MTGQINRRLILAAGALLVAGVAGGRWFNIGASLSDGGLSVGDAHQRAVAGEILLIDIRRPDEWARTGVAAGAEPLDMRLADFQDRLAVLMARRPGVPVAVICARGVRSRALSARLRQAGIDDVMDVPEGMLGSGAGPGWLAAGLPLVRP